MYQHKIGVRVRAIRQAIVIGGFSALFLSAQCLAVDITGRIVDTNGKAIDGAKVILEGSNIQTTTDAEGNYSIKNFEGDHVHLHVYSPNHVHGDRELEALKDTVQADFTLRPTLVENVVVTANPLRSSVLESTVPVSVLRGEALEDQKAPTLGESLGSVPGVHNAYYGPGVGSPIIRGTDGPRVKILQNGLDVSDASRVGADHNVAAEASSAEQIEVIRGPATLQFGSGAVGGVVNVVDQRIPSEMPERGFEGDVEVSLGTVADEEYAHANFVIGAGSAAFYLDAFSRQSDNIEIPGFAEAHHEDESEEEHEEHEEEKGTLENSAIDNQGITIGGSIIGNWGFAGVSIEHMENRYGVPGHAHEGEHHDDDPVPTPTPSATPEPEEDHHEEEERVEIDVELQRVQLAAELHSPFEGVSALRYRGNITDYEHTELENDETGTVFSNETMEHKLALEHENLGGWHGVVGLHYSATDYAADGEEAFTPSNDSSHLALFVVEAREFGDFNVQLGGRVEASDYSVNDHVEVELGEHEEPAPGDPEEHHEIEVPDQNFTSLSLSAGTVWEFTKGQSIAASLSHSERAPSHQEMFSAGQHIGTRTFDIGLAYEIEEGEEPDEYEVELGDDPEREVTNSLDITWRLFEGDTTASVSVFYNQVSNYIYQADTGIVAEVEAHHHEEEEEEGEEEHLELPVYKYLQDDATIHGFEAEVQHHLGNNLVVGFFGDMIHAEIDGGNLPRIPPLRIGSHFGYKSSTWNANLLVNWHDDQTDVAEFEEETEGYMLVDANISYSFDFADSEWRIFLKGRNLTDEEARPHTSFLKELAPLPGRGYTLGVSTHF